MECVHDWCFVLANADEELDMSDVGGQHKLQQLTIPIWLTNTHSGWQCTSTKSVSAFYPPDWPTPEVYTVAEHFNNHPAAHLTITLEWLLLKLEGQQTIIELTKWPLTNTGSIFSGMLQLRLPGQLWSQTDEPLIFGVHNHIVHCPTYE